MLTRKMGDNNVSIITQSLREIATASVRAFLPVPLVRYIQRVRLERHLQNYHPRLVTHRFGKHHLQVHLKDNLAEGWYDHDWDEPAEIIFFQKNTLRQGALVFDLGAHQAVVAMLLSKEVGDKGKVVAVEGTLHNYTVAKLNLEQNKIPNIQMIHAVITSPSSEKISFSDTLNGQARQGTGSDLTQTITINQLVELHGIPDLVFLDIEGFECLALQGASLCFNGKTQFFIEVHVGCGLEGNGSVEELMSHFPTDLYRCFITIGEANEICPLDIEALPKDCKFKLFALPL